MRIVAPLVLLLLCAPVAAQTPGEAGDAPAPQTAPELAPGELAEPTDSQRVLLEQADAAFAAQNPALAQSLLQRAADEQPLKSIYLRLAAGAAQDGECVLAQSFLGSADVAPADQPEVQHTEVRAAVERSLQGRCGILAPDCLPGDIILELVEGQHVACADKPFWMPPGKRTLFFDFAAAAPSSVTVTVAAGKTVKPLLISASERHAAVAEAIIYVSDALPMDIANRAPPVDPPLDLVGPGTLRIAGWSLVGAGALSAVAGVVFAIELGAANEDAAVLAATDRFDATKADRALDDGRFFQTAEFTAYSLAGAFLITGGVLLWLGSEDEVTVVPAVGPGTAGVVWGTRW